MPKSLPVRALAALAAASLIGLSERASADTIVYSTNPAPGDVWTGPDYQQVGSTDWYYEVTPDGSTGIRSDFARSGNGSAFLQTTSDSGDAEIAYFPDDSLGSFADIKALSYDWYRSSSSTVADHFAPAFALYLSNDGGATGKYVIYEPIYNNSSPYTAPVDTWETADAYSDGNALYWSPGSGGAYTRTLSTWQSVYDGYDVYGVVGFIGTGIGDATFTGAVDNISWQFAGSDAVTVNFEVVPEPSSVVMGAIAGGLGLAAAARRRFRRG